MKVLIAMEESECSRKALEAVLERHWPEDSDFRLVSVHEPWQGYDPIIYAPITFDSMAEADREIFSKKEKWIKEDVERLRTSLRSSSVSGAVLTGEVRSCILDEAKEWGADLIVLGSHGRKGIAKLFLGSVAEGVAANATCSVEIVKPKTH